MTGNFATLVLDHAPLTLHHASSDQDMQNINEVYTFIYEFIREALSPPIMMASSASMMISQPDMQMLSCKVSELPRLHDMCSAFPELHPNAAVAAAVTTTRPCNCIRMPMPALKRLAPMQPRCGFMRTSCIEVSVASTACKCELAYQVTADSEGFAAKATITRLASGESADPC